MAQLVEGGGAVRVTEAVSRSEVSSAAMGWSTAQLSLQPGRNRRRQQSGERCLRQLRPEPAMHWQILLLLRLPQLQLQLLGRQAELESSAVLETSPGRNQGHQ